MRHRILCCLCLLAVCFDAAAGDLYTAIDRLRAGESSCAVAAKLPPLRPQAALERVARDLSRGDNLAQSLKETGYGAARSSVLNIRGAGLGAQSAATLLEQTYCKELQDAAMTEIGIYLDARQVWIVIAAPFVPSTGMSERTAGQRGHAGYGRQHRELEP